MSQWGCDSRLWRHQRLLHPTDPTRHGQRGRGAQGDAAWPTLLPTSAPRWACGLFSWHARCLQREGHLPLLCLGRNLCPLSWPGLEAAKPKAGPFEAAGSPGLTGTRKGWGRTAGKAAAQHKHGDSTSSLIRASPCASPSLGGQLPQRGVSCLRPPCRGIHGGGYLHSSCVWRRKRLVWKC